MDNNDGIKEPKFLSQLGDGESEMAEMTEKLNDPNDVGELKEEGESEEPAAMNPWVAEFDAFLRKEREPEEPSAMAKWAAEADEWMEEELSKLPPEERAAVEAKLEEKLDAFDEVMEKAYDEAEKFCDGMIESLDRLEKWVNDL